MFTWLLPDVPSEVSALLLLVPITIASVLSSWRVGLPIAVLAAFTYAFVLLPPFGEIHIGYTEEAVILVTFSAVAVIVSVVVSRRSIANRAELIGRERMLLLRSVSHDLRNPLNAILAASTDLQSGADYDPVDAQAAAGPDHRRDASPRPDRRQPARAEPPAGGCTGSGARAERR